MTITAPAIVNLQEQSSENFNITLRYCKPWLEYSHHVNIKYMVWESFKYNLAFMCLHSQFTIEHICNGLFQYHIWIKQCIFYNSTAWWGMCTYFNLSDLNTPVWLNHIHNLMLNTKILLLLQFSLIGISTFWCLLLYGTCQILDWIL